MSCLGWGGDMIWNHSGGSRSSNDRNLKSEGNVEFLLSELSCGSFFTSRGAGTEPRALSAKQEPYH